MEQLTGEKIEALNNLQKNSVSLRLPEFCTPLIPDEHGKIPYARIARTLREFGIMVIQMKRADHGETLEDIIAHIGQAHGHDDQGRALWDIKQGGTTGQESLARSHKLNEFVLHTDCSYEEKIPDFFALNVVEPDRFSGGKNLLIDTGTLIQFLSDRALHTLQTKPFKFQVPPEFYKGQESITSLIIDNNMHIRYRREIIDEEDATQEQLNALEEFEDLAYNTLLNRSVSLEKGELLLVDNRRFLHARTEIKDPHRHLQRIRFFLNLRDDDEDEVVERKSLF